MTKMDFSEMRWPLKHNLVDPNQKRYGFEELGSYQQVVLADMDAARRKRYNVAAVRGKIEDTFGSTPLMLGAGAPTPNGGWPATQHQVSKIPTEVKVKKSFAEPMPVFNPTGGIKGTGPLHEAEQAEWEEKYTAWQVRKDKWEGNGEYYDPVVNKKTSGRKPIKAVINHGKPAAAGAATRTEAARAAVKGRSTGARALISGMERSHRIAAGAAIGGVGALGIGIAVHHHQNRMREQG